MSRCFRCACTWCACIELSMFRYHSSRKGTSHTAQLSNSSEIKDVLEQLYGDFHDWIFINFPFPGQSQLALTTLRSMEVDTALYHLYPRQPRMAKAREMALLGTSRRIRSNPSHMIRNLSLENDRRSCQRRSAVPQSYTARIAWL